MRVNILAGGPPSLWPKDLFAQPGTWIGVDRGAWYLYQEGLAMNAVIGDFDSLSEAEYATLRAHLQDTEIEQFPPEKDFTDTALALRQAQKLGADVIYLYGATGGRIDHLLSNLWLPAEAEFSDIIDRLVLVDCQNQVTYLTPGDRQVRQVPGMKYLGFMPLGLVDNLVIHDAKYTLTSAKNKPKMWSSNEFVTELVHVSFDTGILMVTQSKDGGI
ncbi:thiamine diphosphokinase [Leuconostocaceae bacterium ESL0723]|nr:thiamine diphosphokinase [Leuconostocaceae bacterium ESL0723]